MTDDEVRYALIDALLESDPGAYIRFDQEQDALTIDGEFSMKVIAEALRRLKA